ncbi:MAG: UvrD-helicase domain-containing protein [Desulfovermiculus sp.]|nr:UvrD-helicase domain-containing protein [Desulfovermiculus sp.]
MPSPPRDAEQRAAALDPTRSFIVQAPAGSGKTELLTQRTLALLATVQAPEEVMAITFTRKAAGEMRARILHALHRAAAGEKSQADHEKTTLDLAQNVLARSHSLGWELPSSPSRLRIQTIDSLCSGLVARMPLLSRLGSQGRIGEDPEQMYMQAAQATLTELENNSPWSSDVRTLLAHLDNDMDKTSRLIAGMLPQREQWLRHLADPDNRQLQRPGLEEALTRAVEDVLGELRELIPSQSAQSLIRLAGFAAPRLPDPEKMPELSLCSHLQDLPGSTWMERTKWQGLARLSLTGSGGLRKRADKNLGFPPPSGCKDPETKALFEEMKDEFSACMQALGSVPGLEAKFNEVLLLPEPRYRQEQWTVLESLFEVLRLAVGHLHLVFQDWGEVDFAEVTSRARQALGSPEDPTDLALILDHRIQHLLIDEFQDTSISQFVLLQSLTAGWSPGDGRTFFAVGDPMQSIYSFREAEVGLFLQSRQQGLGHIHLTPLTLSVNFRSQAGVVDWVNQAFPRVLPQAEDPLTGSVPYSPAHAFLPPEKSPAVNVHPFFHSGFEHEAEEVVSLIRQAREVHPQGTTAVLVRSRSHLREIVPALSRAGLSFQALDIDPLSRRPIVQDLCALAKALRHPGHNLAWMAVLRAPWSGLELPDLHLLSPERNVSSIFFRLQDQEVLSRLSPQGQARLRRVGPILEQALLHRDRTSIRCQVESCWQALGGPDCLSTERDRHDAQTFFTLLQDRFTSPGPLLIDALDTAVAELFARPDTETDSGLQVMTIHKAKGLEFDTVILPGLGRPPRSDEQQLLAWLERSTPNGRSDLLLAPRTATGEEKDPIYAYIRHLVQDKARHEDGRLLYVAATRARKRLHLLGHTTRTDKGVRPPASGSLLAALWPAVGPEFELADADEFEANEHTRRDRESPQAQTLYRLIPNWQPPRFPAGVSPAPAMDWEPEEEEIVFDWAGEAVRCAGTCVHGWLLTIARQGLSTWDVSKVPELRPVFVRQLSGLGVRNSELEQVVDLVQEALENTLAHDLGRWILAPRPEAANEYALSGVHRGGIVSVVMDRTFVDEAGVRWIIDYKTSRHGGTDVEGFLEREKSRYQRQMETYARLMQAGETRPIRLGLYFPLLSGWREWLYPS